MEKFNLIPSARDYLSTRPVNIKPSLGQQNNMRRAANQFFDWFTDQLILVITEAEDSGSQSNYISLRVSPDERAKEMVYLPKFEGIPGHVLLYGHLKDNYWQKRNPLVELAEHPFRKLQRLFRGRGWFLIETSDPEKSKYMCFKAHSSIRSLRKDKDYGQDRPLWHGHNTIDLEADTKTFNLEVEEIVKKEAITASEADEVEASDSDNDGPNQEEASDDEAGEKEVTKGEGMDEVDDEEEIPTLVDDDVAGVEEVDHDSGSDTASTDEEAISAPIVFV